MSGPFKMKNSGLKTSAKSGSPMQANYASPAKTDEGRETVKKYASGEKEVKVKGDTRTAAELSALADKAEKDGNKSAADTMRDKAARKTSEKKAAQSYLDTTA